MLDTLRYVTTVDQVLSDLRVAQESLAPKPEAALRISTLESFNKIRNTRSLAHNNSILNYEESLLIYNHVCAAVRFVRALESVAAESLGAEDDETTSEDEFPF